MIKPEQSAGTGRNGAAELQRPRGRRSSWGLAFQTVAAWAPACWWAFGSRSPARPWPARHAGMADRHGSFPAAPAIRASLEHVPVIVLGHLEPLERRAYLLADNKIAERGGWNLDKLKLELTDLAGVGFDLGGLFQTTWP